MIPVKLPHLEHVARIVLPQVGIELVDIDGFTCCPDPVGFRSADEVAWFAIAARNICLAEEKGLDILTLCNGCAYTLMNANKALKGGLKGKVNEILKETGHEFKGTVEIKHFLEVLAGEIEEIKDKKRVNLNLNIATHTGCHLLSPQEVMEFDDPENPTVLDDLVAALGATPLDYDLKTLCCGLTFSTTGRLKEAFELLKDKFTSIKEAGADCIVVGCPFCFQQFDVGQLMMSRRYKLDKIPVLNYLQLLGLSLGYSLQEMKYDYHKVKDLDFENKIQRRGG